MTPQAKIEEIALYLGKPWKFSRLEPSNWRFEIIDGTGRGLCLRLDGDKIRISGIFPRHKCRAYSSDYQIIGVSIARHSKEIAADILRRLIPAYLKSYETALLRYVEEQGEAQIWSGDDVTLNLKKLSVTQALRIIGALNDGEP